MTKTIKEIIDEIALIDNTKYALNIMLDPENAPIETRELFENTCDLLNNYEHMLRTFKVEIDW